MMNRVKSYILYLFGLPLLLMLALFLTGVIFAPKLPVSEITAMQNTISTARRLNAAIYAGKDFSECMDLYNSAMQEWKTQNEKWIILRNYGTLRDKAIQVTECADMVINITLHARDSLRDYIEWNSKEITNRDDTFRRKFNHIPLPESILKDHSSGHMKLLEATEAYKSNNFVTSYHYLAEAESYYCGIEKQAAEVLNAYFSSFNDWDTWLKQTVKVSRENKSYAIIIDKMAHTCSLYKNGKMIRQYDAEFSPRWMGDKNHQGDDATPEGLYYITKKLDSRQTKFYKALMINYPNEEDKKRYEQAVQAGTIPNSVGIGNLIEIHGNGGKGRDWTNGCIALTNSDMDHLFSLVSIGVPVAILGSTVPLDQLFSDE
jgi:hypothetical protein